MPWLVDAHDYSGPSGGDFRNNSDDFDRVSTVQASSWFIKKKYLEMDDDHLEIPKHQNGWDTGRGAHETKYR